MTARHESHSTGPLVTFTSDFGSADAYVPAVKGVIASINPRARIIDTIHQIPPHNIVRGALMLKGFVPYYPPGTIHLAVVDPGVGSKRRALLIVTDHGFFVGPDNGLFALVVPASGHKKVIHLKEKRFWLNPQSPVFHARDIFAPVAAYLSRGVKPEEFGPEVKGIKSLAIPKPHRSAAAIRGDVISVDRFGNLTTNIPGEWLLQKVAGSREPVARRQFKIHSGPHELAGLFETYALIPPKKAGAVIGSAGFLEVALNRASAAERLQANVGTLVAIRLSG